MHPRELRLIIERLPTFLPLTDAYEATRPMGGSLDSQSWRKQKDHIIGWLSGFPGPGAYGRASRDSNAAAVYNRLQCAPALLWLGEALGEQPKTVTEAIAAVRAAPKRAASQCAAVRRVIPWSRILELIDVLAASDPRSGERARDTSARRRGLPTVRRQRPSSRVIRRRPNH